MATEIDTKYLRDKNVAAILETIAAEIVVNRPSDPEAYLRERFSESKEETFKSSDAVALYVTLLCPLSAVALIATSYAKLGAQAQFRIVEISEGQPVPSEFSTSSPFQRVPVVTHNGLSVCELGSVVRYCCARTSAYPSTSSRARAKVESAFDCIVNNVMIETVTAINERVFFPRKHQRPVDNISVQAAATRFRAALTQLQSSVMFFEEGTWLMGAAPTIADFALAGAVFGMHHVAGFDCVTGLEKINRWWTAVQQESWYQEGLQSFFAAAAKLYSR